MKIMVYFAGLCWMAFLVGCASAPVTIERRYVNDWERDLGYAQCVKVGNQLYLSGIASNAPTMDEQVDSIYRAIESQLADYGVDTSAIIKETAYTKDIEALKKANAVRKKYYPHGEFPSATWVQVERLFMEEFLVEIEVVALLKN